MALKTRHIVIYTRIDNEAWGNFPLHSRQTQSAIIFLLQWHSYLGWRPKNLPGVQWLPFVTAPVLFMTGDNDICTTSTKGGEIQHR